ncbi:MAG: winged helix-turn-helix domain-containing protein [Haloarculaceae archaeon]
MDRDRDATARRAAEAFDVLGNEIRTAILLALLADGPLTFSGLRDRVGVADSGRFNYHLDRLTGQFVRKETGGYRLRYHGRRVAHAALAGTFTETTSFDPVSVEGACRACGERALVGSYEDEAIRIRCRACDERVLAVSFPPSAVVGRSPSEAIQAFERWSRRQADLAREGICPVCASRTETHLDPDPSLGDDLAPVARHDCGTCGWQNCTTVGSAVLDHPAVDRFAREHDLDPRSGPYWSNEYVVTNRHVTVESRDPWRVAVTVRADDARLVLAVDETLAVVETTRP